MTEKPAVTCNDARPGKALEVRFKALSPMNQLRSNFANKLIADEFSRER